MGWGASEACQRARTEGGGGGREEGVSRKGARRERAGEQPASNSREQRAFEPHLHNHVRNRRTLHEADHVGRRVLGNKRPASAHQHSNMRNHKHPDDRQPKFAALGGQQAANNSPDLLVLTATWSFFRVSSEDKMRSRHVLQVEAIARREEQLPIPGPNPSASSSAGFLEDGDDITFQTICNG